MFPDGVVTVAFPLSSTTTVAPGFTALTLSSMAFFSASVSFSGFATTVLSAGLTTSLPAFGLAGAVVSLVTKSANGCLSVEPSVYVTTRFPLASFVTDLILASLSVTGASFEIFASSLSFLYSSCSFSLILAKSASVTFAGSATATFSVGALISYLSV